MASRGARRRSDGHRRRYAVPLDEAVHDMADDSTARDTWRIVGETTVTYDDYMQARHFPDAIAYTLYFIDVHNDTGTHQEFLPPENVPTLPLGCLIPRGAERILVAGRTLAALPRSTRIG